VSSSKSAEEEREKLGWLFLLRGRFNENFWSPIDPASKGREAVFGLDYVILIFETCYIVILCVMF
jgi:hypothetical protein